MSKFSSKQSRILMTEGGLSALLKTLPTSGRRNIRAAVREWAREVRDAARMMAPVADGVIKTPKGDRMPGTLKSAITYGLFNKGLSARAGVFGKNKKKAFYAYFIEYGTKPHHNSKGGGRTLAKITMRGRKMHPGIKEQPFIRPAARIAGPAGARKVIEEIRKSIRQAAASGGNSRILAIDAALARLKQSATTLTHSDLNVAPFSGEVAD